MSKIRLTGDEIRYISLFESVTGATAKDCIIDEKSNRVIFTVKPGDIGFAIGKGGANIKFLRRMTGRDIEVVEYADVPSEFIKNSLAPARVKEIQILDRPDGRRIAVVIVEPRDKGVAIGKNGKTAERTRFLVKRYFQIDNVVIT
ncbi:NusA-like transcription termination signal-binding factor [Candidatus Bathyarchaeota archaeon]|nr:NusA-like transcription termination signal-binding factor [Candidatus Bathyarchaeota archaeon]